MNTQPATNFHIDPRTTNATHHALDQGKVTAVHLTVHPVPAATYACTLVRVIGEDEQGVRGPTVARVAVYSRAGRRILATVILATGYNGGLAFDALLPAFGEKIEHTITNKFDPPNLGPLAIYIAGDDGKQIDSDVVASLGLPYGHHVSYEIEFRERSILTFKEPAAPINEPPAGDPDLLTRVQQLEARMSALEKYIAWHPIM